jgi:hypothetical protein
MRKGVPRRCQNQGGPLHESGLAAVLTGTLKFGTTVFLPAHQRNDRLSRWIVQLQARVGYYKTLVAVANKHARILWAVLARGERFDPSYAPVRTRRPHEAKTKDAISPRIDFAVEDATGKAIDRSGRPRADSKPQPRVLRVAGAVRPSRAERLLQHRPARRCLETYGFRPGYQLAGLPHRTGHGIGLHLHEAPYLVGNDETLLEAGTCFSNEPMICIPGEFGVRHEDQFHMTEERSRWFT